MEQHGEVLSEAGFKEYKADDWKIVVFVTPKEVHDKLLYFQGAFGSLALGAVVGEINEKFKEKLMEVVYEHIEIVPKEMIVANVANLQRSYPVMKASEVIKKPIVPGLSYSAAITNARKLQHYRDVAYPNRECIMKL